MLEKSDIQVPKLLAGALVYKKKKLPENQFKTSCGIRMLAVKLQIIFCLFQKSSTQSKTSLAGNIVAK